MKVVYALLTSIFLGFGAKAEILETKTVDNGGSGMFKAIAVEDSEMPDFVIYRPQDLIHVHARAGELPVPLLFAFATNALCRCGLPYNIILFLLSHPKIFSFYPESPHWQNNQ